MNVSLKPGLYIIPTPIGNLKDITLRCLEYLKSCDFIYCEDTRVTLKLLQAYSINRPLLTYHEHNAEKARVEILEKIQEGAKICLVSDAGMPLISDPGYKLIREIQSKGLYYTALPGACAAISALCLSGMPTNQFFFAGFFESKMAKNLRSVPSSIIFYESARRLLKSLAALKTIFDNRQVAVVREISKIYEEVIFGDFEAVMDSLSKKSAIKGEIVVVLSPAVERETSDNEINQEIQKLLKNHSVKDIAEIISQTFSIPKKQAYTLALEAKNA